MADAGSADKRKSAGGGAARFSTEGHAAALKKAKTEERPEWLQEDVDEQYEDGAQEEYERQLAAEAEEAGKTTAYGATDWAKKFHIWKRKPMPKINPYRDNLVFQQLELDYYLGPPATRPPPDTKKLATSIAPVIRVYGLTEAGNTVMCHVHGFEPYFYADLPSYGEETQTFCDKFRTRLNEKMLMFEKQSEVAIVKIELERKQNMLNYRFGTSQLVMKITTGWPKHVPMARNLLRKDEWGNLVTYEAKVLFSLRFMVDKGVTGACWMEAPATKFVPRAPHNHATSAQYEFDIWHTHIVSHAPEGKWSSLAPFRIMSFDIECAGRRGHFPDAKLDPVIQIANYVTEQGCSKPMARTVFVLNSCAPIVGAKVFAVDDERELLLAWKAFVEATDPDVVIGYNIVGFDIPYLVNRAETLRIESFPYLGRLKGTRTVLKKSTFSSKAYGTRESFEINLDGRFIFDILQVMQRDYKLSSYSLNNVSAEILGDQKEDVHHSIISELHAGDEHSRRRLAVYCLKDAYLPQQLLDKLMMMYNYVEMARVTGVPVGYLLSRGQQIKVISQLLRKIGPRGMIMPVYDVQGSSDVQYEGATVLDPIKGFYQQPIATLDFASLYPSIMMAHNLCYTTLVAPRDVAKLTEDQYTKTPRGDVFVKQSVSKGLLPEILEELLGARKKAKKALKAATDPLQRAVLDGRQLALKVSANSVYGFTGATVGQLPCLAISASVTAFGREMIDQSKRLVEQQYRVVNGYEHDAIVVYGDTDSVMVKFGPMEVGKCMEMGVEAAAMITKTFVKPISLEFEKIYFPYLLISKKRYAGMYWTNPDAYDKMDCKGIETVRRDNCQLVKTLLTKVLKGLLIDRDVPGTTAIVKSTIRELLMDKIDLSELVITKAYSVSAEKYANKQAHIELAERMRKRDAATAPQVGDRIAYVMTMAAKSARAYEKSEDPIYVLDHGIPIDCQWYLDHQLKGPLERIFAPVLPNLSSLFEGDHTRSVKVHTPSTGGIMRFAVKKLKCMHCKAPIAKGNLCTHCKDREGEICVEKIAALREKEQLYSRLWTQCQRCQGSLHIDVLCTSRDCPIFYRRKKVKKDMDQARTEVDRFAW